MISIRKYSVETSFGADLKNGIAKEKLQNKLVRTYSQMFPVIAATEPTNDKNANDQ